MVVVDRTGRYVVGMSPRNVAAIVLTIVSLGLLWPGLTEPVLTITASMKLLGPPREIFRQTQSIAQTMRSLYDSGNLFVAGLVLLFSITVPFIKALLMFVVLTWYSLLFGIVVWIAVVGALRLMTKADPMMRQVYLRHIRYQQTYRPTSSPWRRS